MPGDPFRHVRPGQKLEVPAAAYNAFLDAARRERGRMLDTGRDRDADGRKYGVIKVRNASGGDVPRFGVLALTGPIIAPYPELAEFQAQVAIDGETPVGPDKPFAILLEPLEDQAIGRAVVAGIVPVRLTTDGPPGLGYAVPIDGSVINLRPAAAGPAWIVWTDGEWALVHLGLDEPLLRIRLTASLVPKGSAAADPLVRKDGDWTSAGASITVHDPLGLAKLAAVNAGSSSTPSAPVGTLGIAHRFTDAKRWELIALEPSAVKTEADDDGDPGEDGSSYVDVILSKLCVVKSSDGNVTSLHYRNESGVCVPVPECPSDCTESGSGYGSGGDGDDDSGGTGGSGGSPPTPVSFLFSDSDPGDSMFASDIVDESPRRVSAPIVPCGVVIGCYRWPALAELQVRVLRETCGPDVPVLLSVDPHSDERDRGYLALEANHPNVTVSLNLARYGHGPGDLAAFWKGIDWARGRGIRVLAKLSHRFVPTRPGWLADGALDLLASRLSAATRACDRDGPTTWPLRTEAMLLDVAAWGRGDVRGHLNPARGLTRDEPAAESVVWNALAKIDPGHRFHPWDLLHADRNRRLAGAVWHGGDPASTYRDLAAGCGITLEPDFTTDSWWKAGDCLKGLRGALSIIIPTLGRPTLSATLDSVVGQLRGGDEVWIVSDGPRPDALKMAQRYAAKLGGALIRFAEGPATPGGMGGPQRNRGMQLATGSHLLFMDDDDVYLPGALDAIRRGIAAHRGVPILSACGSEATCCGRTSRSGSATSPRKWSACRRSPANPASGRRGGRTISHSSETRYGTTLRMPSAGTRTSSRTFNRMLTGDERLSLRLAKC